MGILRVNRSNALKPANYLNITDIMRIVGISRKTVYNYFSYGVSYEDIGKRGYVDHEMLSTFLLEKTVKTIEKIKAHKCCYIDKS